ncbi:MAG TPA: hypothetical protein VGI65_10955 [Steroidobacteraceae bacterium]
MLSDAHGWNTSCLGILVDAGFRETQFKGKFARGHEFAPFRHGGLRSPRRRHYQRLAALAGLGEFLLSQNKHVSAEGDYDAISHGGVTKGAQ